MTTLYDQAQLGDGVILAFGAKGEQYAHVVKRRGGAKGLRTWRKRTGTWTQARLLRVDEIIRFATQDDLMRFSPDFGIPWENNW
jgi:hypothetical protein